MKKLFEKYGKKNVVTAGIGLILILGILCIWGIGSLSKPEKIDYLSAVSGLRNWKVEVNTKDVDYLDGVKWNKEYVKKVTVDASKVDLKKEGKYTIVYTIDPADKEEKDITSKKSVEVISKEDAEKAAKSGDEVVSVEGVKNKVETKAPANEDVKKNTAKDTNAASNGSSSSGSTNSKPGNSSSNSGNTGNSGNSGSTEKPTHQHSWKHYDAVTKWVVDVPAQEAWSEQVPITEMKEHTICNQCGTDLTNADIDAHFKSNNFSCSGYHFEWIEEIVGYDTIEHPAVPEQGHKETITDAFDECSTCGVRK